MLFPYMHIHICSFYRWIKVCWYTLLGFFLCCLLFFFRNNGPHCLYWGSFCVYFPWVIASLIINFPVWWIACKESSPEWHINYVSNGTLRGRPGNRWQHQLRDDSNRRAIDELRQAIRRGYDAVCGSRRILGVDDLKLCLLLSRFLLILMSQNGLSLHVPFVIVIVFLHHFTSNHQSMILSLMSVVTFNNPFHPLQCYNILSIVRYSLKNWRTRWLIRFNDTSLQLYVTSSSERKDSHNNLCFPSCSW